MQENRSYGRCSSHGARTVSRRCLSLHQSLLALPTDVYHLLPAVPSQKNEERTTYKIRKIIEANQDLHQQLADLEKSQKRGKQGAKAQEVIAEALKSKDGGDGQNVLMYAASLGNDLSFTSAVHEIKKRVSDRT